MSSSRKPVRLIHGDLVDVCSAEEIAATLDENGSVAGLPFMPEMLDSLGKRYRVHRRVEHFRSTVMSCVAKSRRCVRSQTMTS